MASRTFVDFYRKTDVDVTTTFTNSAGAAFSCAGGTLKFIIKENKTDDDADALISKSYSPTGAGSNVFNIILSNSETDIDAGEFYEAVQFVSSAGLITVIFDGSMNVMEKLFE